MITYLYNIYNGNNYPMRLWYLDYCTSFCTTFVLKTMRSFVCSFAQTMMQTIYQPICRTILKTILIPIPFFARHSARVLPHFYNTENN